MIVHFRCADQVYARAQNLLAQYKDMGVPTNKIIIRIPGTWEGIQAAKKLEAEGIATHIILIYRCVIPTVQFVCHSSPCSVILYLCVAMSKGSALGDQCESKVQVRVLADEWLFCPYSGCWHAFGMICRPAYSEGVVPPGMSRFIEVSQSWKSEVSAGALGALTACGRLTTESVNDYDVLVDFRLLRIIFVCSFAQAAAAAQAGASVIQPNIGRLGDWYTKHPGVIRNPKGPREDSGVTNTTNPGIRLTERIYNYCQQFYPKTRVMVSGIRKKDGMTPTSQPHLSFCRLSVHIPVCCFMST
jgi:hypothetical protein